MRFLHTADWHLGRLFHGVHLTGDQAPLLDKIFLYLKEIKAHCLIISGDIFDRAQPPVEAIKLFSDFITRVSLDLKTQIVAIAGNHDSPDRLGFASELLSLSGAHIRGNYDPNPKPIIVEDQWGTVAIHAIPYSDPSMVRERLDDTGIVDHQTAMEKIVSNIGYHKSKYPRSIAVGHAYVTGGERSESERPLSLGSIEEIDASVFSEFSYTALGHLHRSQKIADGVFYSGSLFKYSFEESDQGKSVLFCNMDRDGKTTIENLSLEPERDVRVCKGLFSDLINFPERFGPREDYMMISLEDRGPIVDVMRRLREVYPNVLRVERLNDTDGESAVTSIGRKRMTLSDSDWFREFHKYVTKLDVGDDELEIFSKTVDDLRTRDRG